MSNQFRLDGKTVVITGATGILGKTFCLALVQAGANLAMIDRDQTLLDQQAKMLSLNSKSKTIGYKCDIAEEKDVVDTIIKIEKDFGKIDVLHNNAASKGKSLDDFFLPYEKFKLETWREIMSVNIDGAFLVTKHIGAHMVKNGIKGSIIQTASVYAVVAPDQRIYEGSYYMDRQINTPAVYSASKAALIGLSNYLATYWGHVGIRVNVITPGGIESGQNETFKNKYSARVPIGRMGKADELVGALLFLASDSSSYVTGQNIVVDGGLTVW